VLVLLFSKQSVASCKGKGKGSVSSFSSEKYDKVYFIPVDGVPVLTKQKSTVRQFMQLTELVTKLMW
jgi:hypothetical protein